MDHPFGVADDLISIAESAGGIRRMFRMMGQACDQCGKALREDKLCLRSNFPGDGIRIGSETLLLQAGMVFLLK